MPTKLPNSFILFFSFFGLIFIYWPALNGGPIWDDIFFLFESNVITGSFSYLEIFKSFNWPISVGAQKFIYGFFHHQYFLYHLLNLLIHCLNSFLLFKVLKKLEPQYSWPVFILFLIHPANVLTVSWIIQFKTLLCFFTAIISFLFLMKAMEQKNRNFLYYGLSWFFFLLSLGSKSSAAPLCLFFILYSLKASPLKPKNFAWIVALVLITLLSLLKLFSSDLTKEGVERLSPVSAVKKETNRQNKSSNNLKSPKNQDEKDDLKDKLLRERILKKLKGVLHEDDQHIEAPPVFFETKKSEYPRGIIFLKSIHYYFWQTILPLSNEPIKGLKSEPFSFKYGLHLLFILILLIVLILLHKRKAFVFILLAYLTLTPFLGVIAAPYMNLTLVSDQHLYLALPFFLLFWIELFSHFPKKINSFLMMMMMIVIFFGFFLIQASSFYQNELEFFRASHNVDPTNIPVAINLSLKYSRDSDPMKSFQTILETYEITESLPELKSDPYYPELWWLYNSQRLHLSQP